MAFLLFFGAILFATGFLVGCVFGSLVEHSCVADPPLAPPGAPDTDPALARVLLYLPHYRVMHDHNKTNPDISTTH